MFPFKLTDLTFEQLYSASMKITVESPCVGCGCDNWSRAMQYSIEIDMSPGMTFYFDLPICYVCWAELTFAQKVKLGFKLLREAHKNSAGITLGQVAWAICSEESDDSRRIG